VEEGRCGALATTVDESMSGHSSSSNSSSSVSEVVVVRLLRFKGVSPVCTEKHEKSDDVDPGRQRFLMGDGEPRMPVVRHPRSFCKIEDEHDSTFEDHARPQHMF
jgi:hypothetical protein